MSDQTNATIIVHKLVGKSVHGEMPVGGKATVLFVKDGKAIWGEVFAGYVSGAHGDYARRVSLKPFDAHCWLEGEPNTDFIYEIQLDTAATAE